MPALRTDENTYLPKIGIRPTIDGRRNGIRESLEDTTMGLARSVAEFLSANLRHPNGKPVECVVADTCIGGVSRSGSGSPKIQSCRGGSIYNRNTVLVLRFGNNGYGPHTSESSLGV